MRRFFGVLALALIASSSLAQPLMEADSQRFGATYARQPAETPAACLTACLRDGACRAWTYVKPGHQSESGRCELKSAAPPSVRNLCCVSGVTPDRETLRRLVNDRKGPLRDDNHADRSTSEGS